MHYEFSFDPADLREAQRVANRHARSATFGRGLIGWALFVGLAVVLVFLLQARRTPRPATPAPPPAPASAADFLVALLPWILVLAFVYVVVFRQRVRAARNNPILHEVVAFDLADDGVATQVGAVRTHFGWDALDLLVETDRQFLIRRTDKRSWLSLPKRAITDPVEVAAVRDLLAARVRPPANAFPVLPVGGPAS